MPEKIDYNKIAEIIYRKELLMLQAEMLVLAQQSKHSKNRELILERHRVCTYLETTIKREMNNPFDYNKK